MSLTRAFYPIFQAISSLSIFLTNEISFYPPFDPHSWLIFTEKNGHWLMTIFSTSLFSVFWVACIYNNLWKKCSLNWIILLLWIPWSHAFSESFLIISLLFILYLFTDLTFLSTFKHEYMFKRSKFLWPFPVYSSIFFYSCTYL